MRLDKFLCDTENLSRKEARDFIKKGLVSVNGTKITDFGFIVKETGDRVLFKDKPITYEKFVYYMLNKPAGVVSATTDPHDTTVIDLLKAEERKNLFPVGRLDKDTVGLLIITDDGDLGHHLTSPKHHVAKTYLVRMAHSLTEADISALESGVELTGDGMTKPAKVEVIAPCEIKLTITEGMYHQVKRMLKAVGNEVTYLKRLSMGEVVLEESLAEGSYRRLTEEEILSLKE
ncbi:MAG: 16S rRNA pseudouridine(516) synthase [Lachnospiraceae bacterium]|nr:16S rRNA pseudouridine(516) synthase [Lachnospiraceae bacterium]